MTTLPAALIDELNALAQELYDSGDLFTRSFDDDLPPLTAHGHRSGIKMTPAERETTRHTYLALAASHPDASHHHLCRLVAETTGRSVKSLYYYATRTYAVRTRSPLSEDERERIRAAYVAARHQQPDATKTALRDELARQVGLTCRQVQRLTQDLP